jgi:hypothetical protein
MDSPLDLHDEPPGQHGYGVATICLFIRLVLAGVSLRGAARVLTLIDAAFGLNMDIPDWTTGRLWLMRLGHAMLTMPLQVADDWAWLIDHSVQIGQEKCLVVLGIRLSDVPAPGQSLRYQDMRLIALVPRTSWTRQEVDDALEAASQRTGVPRVIVTDHGGDVLGGTQIFQERHPGTMEIYDIKHKAACLLKGRLEKNPRWQAFQRQVGQTRCAVQQTELGFLTPPAPQPKARFMNLQPQLAWADGVLEVLRSPPARVLQWTSAERLQAKLGWLKEFEKEVSEWSHWQAVVDLAVTHVNAQGLTRESAKDLDQQMPRQHQHASTADLANELTTFVANEAEKTNVGERFPGSTEVLESCFGKMKELEKQQSRAGFTSLLLSFGALVANTTTEVIEAAMQHSGTAEVNRWCQENIGPTLFGKRRAALRPGATKAA